MDKTALITGASRGLGFVLAEKFHKLGWNLALTSRDRPIDIEGKNILKGHLDVYIENDVYSFVKAAETRFRKIDVLINDAGYCHPLKHIEELTVRMFEASFEVNTIGPFLFMKHVIPIMKKNGNGAIVNIASKSGENPNDMLPGYGASKAAVIMLTKIVQKELIGTNITCNYVSPGAMNTDMRNEVVGDASMQESPEKYAKQIFKMIGVENVV